MYLFVDFIIAAKLIYTKYIFIGKNCFYLVLDILSQPTDFLTESMKHFGIVCNKHGHFRPAPIKTKTQIHNMASYTNIYVAGIY